MAEKRVTVCNGMWVPLNSNKQYSVKTLWFRRIDEFWIKHIRMNRDPWCTCTCILSNWHSHFHFVVYNSVFSLRCHVAIGVCFQRHSSRPGNWQQWLMATICVIQLIQTQIRLGYVTLTSVAAVSPYWFRSAVTHIAWKSHTSWIVYWWNNLISVADQHSFNKEISSAFMRKFGIVSTQEVKTSNIKGFCRGIVSVNRNRWTFSFWLCCWPYPLDWYVWNDCNWKPFQSGYDCPTYVKTSGDRQQKASHLVLKKVSSFPFDSVQKTNKVGGATALFVATFSSVKKKKSRIFFQMAFFPQRCSRKLFYREVVQDETRWLGQRFLRELTVAPKLFACVLFIDLKKISIFVIFYHCQKVTNSRNWQRGVTKHLNGGCCVK